MPYKFNPFIGTLQQVSSSSDIWITTPIKTANYTAKNSERVRCDTETGAAGFTVTLPSVPSNARVKIIDIAGSSADTGFGAYPLTVVPSGSGITIMEDTSLVLDTGMTNITLELIDGDWRVVDLLVPKLQVVDWDEITNKPTIDQETIVVHLSDNVTPVGTGTSIELITLRYNFTITGVWFETPFQAPTGSAAIVRVLANAVNIFTSADALTIPASSTSVGPLVPNTAFLASGTVLRFDIQQVGATNTGLGYRVTLQGTRS